MMMMISPFASDSSAEDDDFRHVKFLRQGHFHPEARNKSIDYTASLITATIFLSLQQQR